MAEAKGKYITLFCSILDMNPEAKADAVASVKRLTGKAPEDLDPEGWFDTEVVESIFRAVEKHQGQVMAWAAIKVMGRRVYPIVDETVGLPKHLKTPLERLKWDSQSFLDDHRGPDVVPRKFIKTEPGHVIVEAPSPGYNCILIEGVYEGLLDLSGIRNYRVTQTRCVKRGDPTCEYDITWSEA